MTDHNAILNWKDDGERYEKGFFLGSQGNDGEHLREETGWPFSIYKKGRQLGVTDFVLCCGIQHREDAVTILRLVNSDLVYWRATLDAAVQKVAGEIVTLAWNSALDAAAEAVKNQDRTGREWVPGSLWGMIYDRFAPAILALKRPTQESH